MVGSQDDLPKDGITGSVRNGGKQVGFWVSDHCLERFQVREDPFDALLPSLLVRLFIRPGTISFRVFR